MVNVLVSGATGRMGAEVIHVLNESESLNYFRGVGRDAPEVYETLATPLRVEVVIDFSLPELFKQSLQWACENKIPFVSGTTGIGDLGQAQLNKVAQEIPVFWAPNMSLGVNFIGELLRSYSQLSEGFDFKIEEFHHQHKKDTPSGTALFLKKQLDQSTGKESGEIHATRAGETFGIHRVWALSGEEKILLEHTALNRRVFAKGAVMAAEWLLSKPPGCYGMNDIVQGS